MLKLPFTEIFLSLSSRTASKITGLVTLWNVRLPVIFRLLPFTAIPVLLKVTFGYWYVCINSLVLLVVPCYPGMVKMQYKYNA